MISLEQFEEHIENIMLTRWELNGSTLGTPKTLSNFFSIHIKYVQI